MFDWFYLRHSGLDNIPPLTHSHRVFQVYEDLHCPAVELTTFLIGNEVSHHFETFKTNHSNSHVDMYLHYDYMKVSINGGTPKSSICRSDFPL